MSDDRRRSVSLEAPMRKGTEDPGARALGMSIALHTTLPLVLHEL